MEPLALPSVSCQLVPVKSARWSLMALIEFPSTLRSFYPWRAGWRMPPFHCDFFKQHKLLPPSPMRSLFFFFFFFLGPLLWHMEVPRLGVQSELQLPASTTATADQRCVCDLPHSSWQRRILNPQGKARDRTHNLLVPSWIHFCRATTGTPREAF